MRKLNSKDAAAIRAALGCSLVEAGRMADKINDAIGASELTAALDRQTLAIERAAKTVAAAILAASDGNATHPADMYVRDNRVENIWNATAPKEPNDV